MKRTFSLFVFLTFILLAAGPVEGDGLVRTVRQEIAGLLGDSRGSDRLLTRAAQKGAAPGCGGGSAQCKTVAGVEAASASESSRVPAMNRLLFGGDVMLSRHVYRLAAGQKDPAYPFREIAREFAEADIAFVNLESPFARSGPFFEDRMVFRTEPSMIDGLKLAGIDVVSTANNHVRDAGPEGITFTLDLLERHGIAGVGTSARAEEARSGVVIERHGVRFGFLAYTFDQRNGNHRDMDPRVAMLNPATLGEDVRALRKRCDTVIVSMHAGFEYSTQPNFQQQQFGRAAIDAGATVVVGHHPHVPQPVEVYKDGLIFHSLGNLVFDQFERNPLGQGAIAEVIFAGPRVAAYQVRDVEIRNTVPRLMNKSLAGR